MIEVKLEPFPIKTREDVEYFERSFYAYLETNGGFAIQHISLLRTYDALQCNPQGGRIFSAVLDISINLGLIWCDLTEMGRCLNKIIQESDANTNQIKFIDGSFDLRMKLHRHTSAYIYRYRSLWDKIMGLLVLVLAHNEYEKFSKAQSKKKAFAKIGKSYTLLPSKTVEDIQSILQKFDDKFRTGEVHGTGSLRKVSFIWAEIEKSHQTEFIEYWNLLNHVAHIIGGLFDPQKRASDEDEHLQVN